MVDKIRRSMRKHQHDTDTSLGVPKCRTCGEIVSGTTVVVRTQSAVRAKTIAEEIAVAGRYTASGMRDGYVLYTRKVDGVTDEISVKRVGSQNFKVTRSTEIDS